MSQQVKAGQQTLRGWEKTLEQLHEARDRGTFLQRLLDLQCRIVAAEYGAMWQADEQGQPVVALTWPATLSNGQAPGPLIDLLKRAATTGMSEGKSCVLEAKPEGAPDDPGNAAHVFVTVIRSGGKVRAVATVVAACRDKTVLQQTAPMRELAAGLYEGFEARQAATAALELEQRMRRSVALLAVCQNARGFKGSAMNLVNELARQSAAARVSLGWVRGSDLKLVAMSDTEHLKRHNDQAPLIELAMSECLDQQQPIACPPPEGAEPLLREAVLHAHRKLATSQAGQGDSRQVVSVPLRVEERWLGVLTVEGANPPIDAQRIGQLQLVADVVSPHLADRRESDRTVAGFAWHRTCGLAGKLIGPRHVGWKLLGIALSAVLLYGLLGSWTYRVSAPFTLEAEAKRILPTPFEGNLSEVLVRPGDVVKAGDVLARLSTYELELERNESLSRLTMLELQKSKAQGEFKTAEVQQAQAGVEQVRARLALLEYQIGEAAITSPIDGVVLTGDWNDRVGGVMEKGEAMFEVAPLDHLVAVARVHERNIDDVTQGMTGQLATRTQPDDRFNLTVERIVPLAVPHENRNVFEVRCRIDQPADWLKPNMEGNAKLEVGRRRIVWILAHDFIDLLRLWVWF